MQYRHGKSEEVMQAFPDWDITRFLGRLELDRQLNKLRELKAQWDRPDDWLHFDGHILEAMLTEENIPLHVFAANAVRFSREKVIEYFFSDELDEDMEVDSDDLSAEEMFEEIQSIIFDAGITEADLWRLIDQEQIPEAIIETLNAIFETATAIATSANNPGDTELATEISLVDGIRPEHAVNDQFIDVFHANTQQNFFHLKPRCLKSPDRRTDFDLMITLAPRNQVERNDLLDHTLALACIFDGARPLICALFTIESVNGYRDELTDETYLAAAEKMEDEIRGIAHHCLAHDVTDTITEGYFSADETIHSLLLKHNGKDSKNGLIFLNDIQFLHDQMDPGQALTCLLDEIIIMAEQGPRARIPVDGWKGEHEDIFRNLCDDDDPQAKPRTLKGDPLCDHVRHIFIERPTNVAASCSEDISEERRDSLAEGANNKLFLLKNLLRYEVPARITERVRLR